MFGEGVERDGVYEFVEFGYEGYGFVVVVFGDLEEVFEVVVVYFVLVREIYF